MANTRIYAIGLDGGSWNIIDRLIERGGLPHLARLKDEGAWGVLRSTLPPVTCPAWFTFSTGLKPSRLGIYDFRGMKRGTNRLSLHTYREIEAPEFWDLLMREGYSCGIVNNPLLYPRKEHKGYVVPGFITPQEEFRTYPIGLIDELNGVTGGYEVDQEAMNLVDDDTLLEDCMRVVGKRAEAMGYLLERYPTDFYLGVFTGTDRISHRFMNRAFLGEGEERERGWGALAAVYGMVDEAVGRVMEMMGEDDALMIMSDHGFEARPWNLHVNQFLVEEGLLKVAVRGTMEKLGLTQRNIGKYLHRMGLAPLVNRLVPKGLRKVVPAGESIFGETFIHDLIEGDRLDWERTSAVSIGYCSYLNTADRTRGILSRARAEEVGRRIAGGLEGLKDPEGGSDGAAVVDTRYAYGTAELVDPPDQMLLETGRWQIRSTLPRSGDVFTPNERAGHSLHGIFMLRHPQARPGELPGPLGIEDLAPLVLHLFGLPAHEGMDGGVRPGVFRPGSPLDKGTAEPGGGRDTTRAEEERIRRRIAALRKSDSL